MNITMKIAGAALLLVLAPSLFGQPSPVTAKLVIPETKLLPGVPFDAWVELENRSGATLAVGLYPSLRAATAEGFSFEFHPETPDVLIEDRVTGQAVLYLELPAGAHETIALPLGDLLGGASVFNHERITAPGRYSIALRLDAWPAHKSVPAAPDHFAGAVITNDVVIERIEPTGSDAPVWARLQELAGNAKVRWTPALWPANYSLLNEILSRYPESGYVPYALLAGSFGNVHEKYLALTLSAIRRFPSSPVIDQMRWLAAGVADQLVKPDVAEAQRAVIRNSKRPTTRALVFGPEDPARRSPD